eukprot:TRINITY_DN2777_c0_g1_i2.p1 TRINITY_DN2777_c0_g1~~TRINITY_DN2777_c0_g1_i2.p1  ORF type:complete len:616 (-),score=110.76 TRINITY_DN2777_c0_g1_i2:36-1622(-)
MEDDGDEAINAFFVDHSLNPNWIGRLAWDLSTMILVLMDSIILPFQLAYKDGAPDAADQAWLWTTTVCFAFDMLINFFTAYPAGTRDRDIEPGKLVTSFIRIWKYYLRTWFFIDLFSTVPWGLLSGAFLGEGASGAGKLGKLAKMVKFARFLRLVRMMKLAKLATIWERIEAKCGSTAINQAMALLRVVFVMICICHWNACAWWVVGQPMSLFIEILPDETQLDWQELPHWTTVSRTLGPGMEEWTWLDKGHDNIMAAYIFCFYWTLGVMRTVPQEATPVNQAERFYVMVFMFLALSSFAICISLITQTFFRLGERNRGFNDEMAEVRRHMRDIKTPDSVAMKVKSFLALLHKTRRINAKEKNSCMHLPDHVNQSIKQARCLPAIEKIHFLQNLSSKAISCLNELTCVKDMPPGDTISVCNDVALSAWSMLFGRLACVESRVDITSEENNLVSEQRVEKHARRNVETVDEDCLLTPEQYLSKGTVVCMEGSTVLQIQKQDFLDLLAKQPGLLEMKRGSRRSNRGRVPM